jgi:murein L,D-transpeptidase YafK
MKPNLFLAALAIMAIMRSSVADSPLTAGRANPYSIIIDKSDYELMLYEDGEWLATYPVVFGNKDQNDKRMEGDRRTPEGSFRITFKKRHPEWGYFLLIDYPNGESFEKFNQRKKSGLIPGNARIGGGIGIHGTRPHEEYAVDRYINWTEGCISVKYSDIFELYEMLPIGTPVRIRQ